MNKAELTHAATPTMKAVIPEWNNAEVTIRKIDGAAMMHLMEQSSKDEDLSDEVTPARRAHNIATDVIYSLIDENTGQRIFEDTPEDRAMILSYGFYGLVRLGKVITEFNRSNLEDRAKNSDASQ